MVFLQYALCISFFVRPAIRLIAALCASFPCPVETSNEYEITPQNIPNIIFVLRNEWKDLMFTHIKTANGGPPMGYIISFCWSDSNTWNWLSRWLYSLCTIVDYIYMMRNIDLTLFDRRKMKVNGFILVSTTSDINECSANTAKCDQTCHDRTPGYTCSCSAGYTLQADGTTCTSKRLTHKFLFHFIFLCGYHRCMRQSFPSFPIALSWARRKVQNMIRTFQAVRPG